MKDQKFLYLFIILILLYATVTLLTPADPAVLAKYNMTQDQARLLSLTIVIPLTAIWFTGFYGFSRIKQYARSIIDTREGNAMNQIANGIMIQVLGLPATATVSALLSYVALENPDLLPMSTIMRNYVSLIPPIIAFYFIAKGAELLYNSIKHKRPINFKPWVIAFIIVSAVYSWIIISQPVNTVTGDAVYYLPGWLIIFTLAIPYLYVWFQGSQAAYQINSYQKDVRGVIFKKALRYLAAGITAIIALSMAIQLLTTTSARLNRLNLTPLLAIIYLLVLFYAVGYVLIALGAKKLKKIEDV